MSNCFFPTPFSCFTHLVGSLVVDFSLFLINNFSATYLYFVIIPLVLIKRKHRAKFLEHKDGMKHSLCLLKASVWVEETECSLKLKIVIEIMYSCIY